MKRSIAVVAAFALSGCSTMEKIEANLASPTTTQAAANLKTLATAFDCGVVVSSAQLSQTIAQLVNAGQSAIGTTGKVYAVSVAICNTLQGAPPAGATVVAPVSAAPVPVS